MKRSLAMFSLLCGAFLVGCESTGDREKIVIGNNDKDTTPQLAAYAANARYPQDANPSTTLRAGATVDRDHNTLRIFNYSDRPLQNVDVWVNGGFVRHVDNIPAHGNITILRSAFYDNAGHTLADQAQTSISRVEIKQADQLFKLMGPAAE